MPRRLRFVFKITATIRSVPTANLNQFTSRRAITKPLSKNFNKNAPTHAPKTVPIPPKRDAPPITAAAIACNSYPIPVEGSQNHKNS